MAEHKQASLTEAGFFDHHITLAFEHVVRKAEWDQWTERCRQQGEWPLEKLAGILSGVVKSVLSPVGEKPRG